MIGTTLGHYRILERLGKGGMGEVFLADDTKLGRKVALKVLTEELASDGDWRQRFEREARAVAALNHPNIVTIHSVEEASGVLFLTLELVDGDTLASHIPPGGLPLDKILAFAIPLTDAVGAAHQRGITHRDLKPVNVMVTSDRRIKVLDFGLAKLAETEQAAMGVTMPADLTGAGRIMGTTAYMSPEQAEGKAVDPRSDVFTLGVMLYEMAVGERPFKGDTQVSLLSSIIKDTPTAVTDLKKDLPRDLARIVGHCLAKDPEDRYQTAKDLRNDLRSLKTDLDSGAVQADSGVSRPVTREPAAVQPRGDRGGRGRGRGDRPRRLGGDALAIDAAFAAIERRRLRICRPHAAHHHRHGRPGRDLRRWPLRRVCGGRRRQARTVAAPGRDLEQRVDRAGCRRALQRRELCAGRQLPLLRRVSTRREPGRALPDSGPGRQRAARA